MCKLLNIVPVSNLFFHIIRFAIRGLWLQTTISFANWLSWAVTIENTQEAGNMGKEGTHSLPVCFLFCPSLFSLSFLSVLPLSLFFSAVVFCCFQFSNNYKTTLMCILRDDSASWLGPWLARSTSQVKGSLSQALKHQ